MKPFFTQSGPPGPSSPHLILGAAANGSFANSQMTGLQELKDEELGLVAQLAGKRMEIAMAQGELDTARQHRQAMYLAIQEHWAFRIALSEAAGECFFTASADADRVAMGEGLNG